MGVLLELVLSFRLTSLLKSGLLPPPGKPFQRLRQWMWDHKACLASFPCTLHLWPDQQHSLDAPGFSAVTFPSESTAPLGCRVRPFLCAKSLVVSSAHVSCCSLVPGFGAPRDSGLQPQLSQTSVHLLLSSPNESLQHEPLLHFSQFSQIDANLPSCPVCCASATSICSFCEENFCSAHIYTCVDCRRRLCGECLESHVYEGHWDDIQSSSERVHSNERFEPATLNQCCCTSGV